MVTKDMKKVLIMGCHPLADSLKRQYRALGCEVATAPFEAPAAGQDMLATAVASDELVLLSDSAATDGAMVAWMGVLADALAATPRKQRLLCHLLVQQTDVLRMLQTTDFCEAVRHYVDVYPFGMDEVWSHSIVLDREPITLQSDRHVHLVVFGMDEVGEQVALAAARTAHYPNYTRDHSLRTRITMVDERPQAHEPLLERYAQLFDNSYYRVVKPGAERCIDRLHKPRYEGQREDFVDVEWEFVEAAVGQQELWAKLRLWAKDERQLLTLVFAYTDQQRNLAAALLLPDVVGRNGIGVYVYCHEPLGLAQWPALRAFGMPDRGYDVTLPYVSMAKTVNYVYDQCYNDNEANWTGRLRYAVEIDREKRETLWLDLTAVKRQSNILNAMTIATKMRSVGLEPDDWEHFYDLSEQDIELLAQVEHNRWSVEELSLGWRPCTPAEQAAIEADIAQKEELKALKVHYDLRAYADLRRDITGKPVAMYDRCLSACLPLIAKAFADERPNRKGGGQ